MANLVSIFIDKDTGRKVAKPFSNSSGTAKGNVYEQTTPSAVWTFVHNQNTKSLIFQIYDENYEFVLADNFKIVDNNTVQAYFGVPMAGFLHIVLF